MIEAGKKYRRMAQDRLKKLPEFTAYYIEDKTDGKRMEVNEVNCKTENIPKHDINRFYPLRRKLVAS